MEHLVNFLCLPLHKVENHILKLNFVTTRQGGKGTAMFCSKNQKCLSFFEQGCRFPKGDVTVDNSKRQFLVQWCCVKTWCWVTWVRGHFLGNFYVTSFWTGIKNFRCQIKIPPNLFCGCMCHQFSVQSPLRTVSASFVAPKLSCIYLLLANFLVCTVNYGPSF